MTDATHLPAPELDTLEPLSDEPMVAATEAPAVSSTRLGLPPIFYRAEAHGEYYRFLFAGLVMTLGCFMPFGADMVPGYQTLAGAFYLVLSLCLVWSMWIAVYSGRFRMKWIMLAVIPFLVGLIDFIWVERSYGIQTFQGEMASGWLDAIKLGSGGTPEGVTKAANFVRAFGPGRIVLFVGTLLNVLFLLSAVFGGVKHGKAQKAAARSALAERRGR